MSAKLSEQDWREIFEKLSERVAAIRDENTDLRAENINLHVQVGDLDEYCNSLRAENEKLRQTICIDDDDRPTRLWRLFDDNKRLRAELDASQKAVDEARKLLTIAEWAKFDKSVLRHYCMFCDHLMGEHYPECELSAWLTAHPANGQDPEGKEE
jgi:predicted RNase H-like nuclease (RuvC/YqgF family)